ncbi:MAG: hypothetical protein Q9198_010531 [Flavoplaca austrocitrina]
MSSSTFESRFIMWLWMAVLSIYTILKPSLIHLGTLDHYNTMDTVFAVIFGGLAIWSFGVWVIDGADSKKKKIKSAIRNALLDNDFINNISMDGKWNKPSIVHMCTELVALGAALFATTIVFRSIAHYIEHNATLVYALRYHPDLALLALVFCDVLVLYVVYKLAPPVFMVYLNRVRRDYKERQEIIDKTTPLVSSAANAFFQVTPTTTHFFNVLFALPILYVLSYVVAVLVIGGNVKAFFKENTFSIASLVIPGVIWANLISPFFKHDLDCIYSKIKGAERNVAEVSTMTDAGTPETQITTPTTQCCGSCKGSGKVDSDDRDGKTIDFDGETFIFGNDPVGQGLA